MMHCTISFLWMLHLVPVCFLLFLAYLFLWGIPWCYPQKVFLNFTLVYWWSIHFITSPKFSRDTFNFICLKSKPLVPTTLPCAFPTINTVTQTRTFRTVFPNPSISLFPSYLSLLLLSKHHSITSSSLLLDWSFLPFLA